MRSVACEQCGQSVPQNTTFRVFDRVLCEPCATTDLQARTEVPDGSVTRIHDPTVCGLCAFDGGTIELATVGDVPVCEPCEQKLRNRPFPVWVKAALAAVLALTVVAMVRNYRFFHGYYAAKQAARLAAKGDFEAAAQRMTSAATSIPEVEAYRIGATLYEGFVLMKHDRSAEALAKFQEIAHRMPPDRGKPLLLQAEIGAAFEAKDYDRMVKSSQELADLHPGDPMSKLVVASAFACQFAASGDEQPRQKAIEQLPPAEARASLPPEQQEYVNRIEHRLATREIIKGEEFKRRYPHGWKPEKQP